MSRVEARARAALGVRFRLHGRDPSHGFDCVGLVAWAAELDTPADYPLRGGNPAAVAAAIDRRLVRAERPAAGDVLLLAAGAGQLHLAIVTVAPGAAGVGGIIHADAALRRVVERPGPPPWPVLGIWRTG